MMKKILAAAIVSAFAAPAFAATANVDIYGKLHMSINAFDDQAAGTSDVGFSSNASRIGFKGAEDLGGGLSAIWQIEQTVTLDEGTSNAAGTYGFASRNSFIGLKGGFGTALIGRHDTPLKSVGRTVDLFGDTMADSRNVMADANGRPNNVLMYMSPSFTGVNFAAAYISGNAAEADDTDMYSLSVTYKNGPLFLGAAYEDGDGLSATTDKAARLAAGFTMGNMKFVGQYDKIDSISGTADSDAWMVGAGFTMGNVVLKANYMESDVDNTGNDPQQWTIGADYNLSKRTSVYALYANGEYITVGSGAGTSDQVGSCTTCGGDISVISLGMTHTF